MTSRSEHLPPVVEHVVADFRRLLEAERVVSLHGLYLVGSVALEHFRPDASGIDFVAVVAG